jgi:hypothetical protein
LRDPLVLGEGIWMTIISAGRRLELGENLLGGKSQRSEVDYMSNEVTAALVGAGVGIIVGGLANWLIARSNFNREKKAELNIRRKSRLYTPLRRSLMRFKIQLGEEKFPEGFAIEPDDPELRIYHYQHGPNFCIWQEMKNDAREYHVPRIIRKRLDGFTSLLAQYNKAMEKFEKIVGKAWGPLGLSVTGQGDWGEGPYSHVTLGVLSCSVEGIIGFYLYNEKIERSTWEEAAVKLLEEVGDSPYALALRDLLPKIHKQTNELIELFSLEIERVVNMYEARKSRWRLKSDGIRSRREED